MAKKKSALENFGQELLNEGAQAIINIVRDHINHAIPKKVISLTEVLFKKFATILLFGITGSILVTIAIVKYLSSLGLAEHTAYALVGALLLIIAYVTAKD